MNHPDVFVVDDETAIGQLVAIALGAHGYKVKVYESAEAFQQAEGGHADPHLLIVDKNLPGLSGFELVDHQRRAQARFEAVMITGYADDEAEERAEKLGICQFIRKPFALDDLHAAVVFAEERLGLTPT